jgi:hypothetical protein
LTYTDGAVLMSKRAADSAANPQDRDQCRDRCKASKICYSYVWNTIDRVCEFKSGTNLVSSYVDYFNGGVKAPYGSGAPTKAFDVRNYANAGGAVQTSTSFPNADPMNYGPCRDACFANSSCQSFVWNTSDKSCQFKSGVNYGPKSFSNLIAGIKRSTTDIPNLWIEYSCDLLPASGKANCRYELAASDADIADIDTITLNMGSVLLWTLPSKQHLLGQKSLADSVGAPTLTLAWDIDVPPLKLQQVRADVTVTRNGAPVVFTVPLRAGATYSIPKPSAADLRRPNPGCQSILQWANDPAALGSISQHLDLIRAADNFYWHMWISYGGDMGGYVGMQQFAGAISRIVFSIWGTKTFQPIAPSVNCTAVDELEGLQPGVSCLLDGSFDSARDFKVRQQYNAGTGKVWVTGSVGGVDIAKFELTPAAGETRVMLKHSYSANEYFGPQPKNQTVVVWSPPSNATDRRKKTALYIYDCKRHVD